MIGRCIPLLLLFGLVESINGPRIRTSKGTTINGRYLNVNGESYEVYQGIPFAEPPVGDLRFKAPVPVKNAPDTYEATKNGKICPQAVMQKMLPWDPETQSEDCLYLNVYVKQRKTSPSLPVMVWIHGGAFVVGSIPDYSMTQTIENLASRDVVFVTIQYRLGLLGFWSNNGREIPGNFAFLDQIAALQWVQENIREFGGDPRKVTIFGESAGGGSVSFLTASPLAQGLFSNAIAMSGSAYAPWATVDEKKNYHQKYAELLDCIPWNSEVGTESSCDANGINCGKIDGDPQDLLDCMQGKTLDELFKANEQMPITGAWAGRVDGIFLPEPLEELMVKRPSLNIMIGACRDEYSTFEAYGDFKVDEKGMPRPAISSAEELRKEIILFTKGGGYQNLEAIQKALEYRYIESAEERVSNYPYGTPEFWLDQVITLKSSSYFTVPAYNDLVDYSKSNRKIYAYSFDYISDTVLPGSAYRGIQRPEPVKNTIWDRFTPSKLNYLSINLPRPMMKDNFHKSEAAFWNGLIEPLQELDENKCMTSLSGTHHAVTFWALILGLLTAISNY